MQLIKVGMCAFGMSGKVFHAPFLKQHPGFSLAGIVERTKNESEKLYPEAQIYRSVEAMLENPALELIVVNTPVQLHFEHAKKAIEAGKNVIVEKPFTVNASEAQELIRLAKENKVWISVYQNRRFDRDFLKVKAIIEEKILGEIKEVEIRFDRYRKEKSGKIHKENPALPGSGALHDLGAHLIDQGVQLFGFPEKIFADVASVRGGDVANDYFEILLFYPAQLRVRLKSSILTKEDHYAYKIFGSNGSFLQERSDNQENELVAGAVPFYGKDWTIPLTEKDGILNFSKENGENVRQLTATSPGNYMHFYQAIYEHIVFDKALPSPAEEVLNNMILIDAALKSSAEEKVLTF